MSEYRRYIKRMWIGVEVQIADPAWPDRYEPYYLRELVGVIRRSGWVRQCGHFCHTHVDYLGKKRYAGNAEARIFPFHSLTLEPGELPKKLELVWLGWCKDKDTPAFIDKRGFLVEIIRSGAACPNTKALVPSQWQEGWGDSSYRLEMLESQGMLRVERVQQKLARKFQLRKLRDEESTKRWAQEEESVGNGGD